MACGDHIYVDRGWITHHGVEMQDGWAIHFASADGTKSEAAICWVRTEDFASRGKIEFRSYGKRFSDKDAATRAESMLGQSGYDLFANNCEHFATWCVAGEHSSAQVEAAAASLSVVGVGAVVPSLGIGVVSSLGGAAAMSGPNLMSGLATVGGSVVGGLTLLSVAAGVLSAGQMCIALRDKPMLPDEERKARRVGRYGAIGGAAIGVGTSIHAVGALGVAGYSGAGLTSGLAALGGVIGGGMVQGVLTSMLIPVVFAAGIGYLLYRGAQWYFSSSSDLGPTAQPLV
jgi:hypothetical protein